MLPKLPYRDGISKWRCAEFRGIRRVPGAGPGALADCSGVTGDGWPALQSADWTKQKFDAQASGVWGSYQYGPTEPERVYVNDGALYLRGTQVCADAALCRPQRIVGFQRFALIYPAKLWARTDVKGFAATVGELPEQPAVGEVWGVCHAAADYDCKRWDGAAWQDAGKAAGSIDASVTLSVTFADGTYAGETAEGNTILAPAGTDWAAWFSVGDAVRISGSAAAENNQTLIVRELEGNELRFYEHSFTTTAEAESVTVSRAAPELDFLCVNENRVWGCRGQRVYASKLGEFRNWNVFDGLTSDSFAVDVLSAGDFTGCVSFLGYPVFFKRDAIYKVYGNRPANFEVMGAHATGCVCGDTLAVAAETLFYLSARGVMAYSGGIPSLVSEALGDFISGAETAFGVSDGRKYYFGYPVTGTEPSTPVFAYDPEKGMWHRQDYPGTVTYGYRGHRGAVFVTDAGARYGDITAAGSLGDAWHLELAETDFGSFSAKYPLRLWLRMENAGPVTVTVSYNGGAFENAFTLAASGKCARNAPVPIRRCDRFAVKLAGSGAMTLTALELEVRAQQTNRKGG